MTNQVRLPLTCLHGRQQNALNTTGLLAGPKLGTFRDLICIYLIFLNISEGNFVAVLLFIFFADFFLFLTPLRVSCAGCYALHHTFSLRWYMHRRR